jgi:hypothetical protein
MATQTVRPLLGHRAHRGLSSLGDWIAPALVCVMCIGMVMAMVSVLLGPAK